MVYTLPTHRVASFGPFRQTPTLLHLSVPGQSRDGSLPSPDKPSKRRLPSFLPSFKSMDQTPTTTNSTRPTQIPLCARFWGTRCEPGDGSEVGWGGAALQGVDNEPRHTSRPGDRPGRPSIGLPVKTSRSFIGQLLYLSSLRSLELRKSGSKSPEMKWFSPCGLFVRPHQQAKQSTKFAGRKCRRRISLIGRNRCQPTLTRPTNPSLLGILDPYLLSNSRMP
jgi:hypothetical protein